MQDRLPRPLEIQAELIILLAEAAVEGVRAVRAARAKAARNRPDRPARPGDTLKPGYDTPLWNALAQSVEAQFRRRGERTRLARVLGLPRQRVTEMLRTRRLIPDGERTLTLLLWLNARRHGEDLDESVVSDAFARKPSLSRNT